MPRHAKVIAAASLPKLAKCPSGNHGLNTITGGASRRNWSVTGRFPCFPPLIKQLPPPLQRMVGDLSDEERILAGIGLVPEESARNEPPKDLADDDPR
jgi:hypothetical protein